MADVAPKSTKYLTNERMVDRKPVSAYDRIRLAASEYCPSAVTAVTARLSAPHSHALFEALPQSRR
jgi:hypothetical protein